MLDENTKIEVGMHFAERTLYGYRTITVGSITQSGKWFTATNGTKFDRSGRSVGGNAHNQTLLEILTDEVKRKIELQDAIQYLQAQNWEVLDPGDIIQVARFLKRKKG